MAETIDFLVSRRKVRYSSSGLVTMAIPFDAPPRLTWKVSLAGGQSRLREAILYVAKQSADAPFFGLVKLNKSLWRADFQSFADRAQPVTGRQYQRLEQGPAPIEMLPILNEMLRESLLRLEKGRIVDFDERRPIPLVDPNLSIFSGSDLRYLDEAVKFYWDKTGKETSDQSHGVAWKTRHNGDPMPYELAYLSDAPLSAAQSDRLLRRARERGLRSE